MAQDEQGRRIATARIEGNAVSGFAQFFEGLGGPSKVVIEACWSRGKIHDQLETLPRVVEIAVANPVKTRLIASAQIKTDSRAERDSLPQAARRAAPEGAGNIDGNALATLMRPTSSLQMCFHGPGLYFTVTPRLK